MSLASNINQLINTHIAYSPTGKIIKQPALLTQLKDANGNGGRPTTSERPIPANMKAVALLQDIYDETIKHQYEMTGNYDGSLRQILTEWATIEDKEWQQHLEHATLDWIDQINTCIDPPRPRRPLHQPCSACGKKYTPDEDGKRIPAVTAWVWDHHGERVATPDQWEVACSSCGAQWHGKEVVKQYWRALR